MTLAEFRRRAEAAFLRANPTATITGWTVAPRRMTYPTGLRGIVGKFHAVAIGHRPAVVTADYDDASGLITR